MTNILIQMRTGKKENYEVDDANKELVISQLRLDLRVDAVKFEDTGGNTVYVLMQAVRLIKVGDNPAEDSAGEPVEETSGEYDSGEE